MTDEVDESDKHVEARDRRYSYLMCFLACNRIFKSNLCSKVTMFMQTTNILVFMLLCKQYLKIMRYGTVTMPNQDHLYSHHCAAVQNTLVAHFTQNFLFAGTFISSYVRKIATRPVAVGCNKNQDGQCSEYSVLRCVFKDFFPPPARPHYSRDTTSLTCQNVLRCQIGYSLVSIIQLCIHQSVEGAAAFWYLNEAILSPQTIQGF